MEASAMSRSHLPHLILGLALLIAARWFIQEQARQAVNTPTAAQHAARREAMVRDQLKARDITHPAVLRAMARVPRHEFVPPELALLAYADRPLPIGQGQTISQPYIVALMTQLADPKPGDRVLDIGTGSGYQAAVLAEMGTQVYSIEIVPELGQSAAARLKRLNYTNVAVRVGDGYRGWPEHAPFQAIILAAAAPEVPPALLDQLAPGGRMVIPVDAAGDGQDLLLISRKADGTLERRTIAPVLFVPMTGEARKPKP
jgi:protein-L-isoaspartate(D-aspartate) O-methyltransferase